MCSTLYIILSVIFLLQSYIPLTECIQCYKCTTVGPQPLQNETKRICSDFDNSERYIVDCPYSTFCMKKTFTVNLHTHIINGTARDCANQMNVIQDYDGERWKKKIIIEEPYVVGCSESNDKGQRSSETTFCYCKGDLCNGSFKQYGQLYFSATIVIILNLVTKLILR